MGVRVLTLHSENPCIIYSPPSIYESISTAFIKSSPTSYLIRNMNFFILLILLTFFLLEAIKRQRSYRIWWKFLCFFDIFSVFDPVDVLLHLEITFFGFISSLTGFGFFLSLLRQRLFMLFKRGVTTCFCASEKPAPSGKHWDQQLTASLSKLCRAPSSEGWERLFPVWSRGGLCSSACKEDASQVLLVYSNTPELGRRQWASEDLVS